MKIQRLQNWPWLGAAALSALLMGCEARVNTSPAPVVKEEKTTIVNPPAEKKTETTVTHGPGATTETKTETTNP